MSTQSLIAVLLALLLPGGLYMGIALRKSRSIRSVTDFFPIRRHLSASVVSATVVAASMSMATVMVTLVDLAPVMAGGLFITILTFGLSIVLLAIGVPRILSLNRDNLTLHAYLGKAYESRLLQVTATIFTVIGYLSIFSMEIFVCVAILEPFFGNWILAFSILYLAFLLTYTLLSGFGGVVATDKWQLLFIGLAIGALFSTAYFGSTQSDGLETAWAGVSTMMSSWHAPLAFCVGIAVINIPAPFSDAGTWQRVCAASSASQARSGLWAAVALFAILWSSLIIAGFALSNSTGIAGSWTADTETLTSAVLRFLGQGSSIGVTLTLFALILGLFSAMISTADSLLIAATQVGLTTIRSQDSLIASGHTGLRQSRIALALMGLGAFAVFLTFRWLGLNVVQLVFAIYGAQLALFPATAATLWFRKTLDLRRLRRPAVASISIGFVSAWSVALWGHFSHDQNLLFFAPAIGLAAAAITLAIVAPTARQKKEVS